MKPDSQPWRSALAALSVVALVGLAACGDDASSADPPSSGPPASVGDVDTSGVTLRVAVLAITSDANQQIRELSGAFADTPYDVKFVEFEGSNAAVEALNAGAVDIGLELQSTVAVLAQGNAKPTWTAESAAFTIVDAALPSPNSSQNLAVHVDSSIQTVADLAGKKVSYARGSLQHYYWVRAAAEFGLDLGDVELVELPSAEGRAAFQSRAIDAIVVGSRFSRQLLREGSIRLIHTSTDVPLYRISIVRRGFLDDPANAAAVADLLKRAEQGEIWESSHPEEVAGVYERAALMDPDDAAFAASESYITRVPLDDAVVIELQRQADVFAAEGVIPTTVDVRLMFDRRFLVSTTP